MADFWRMVKHIYILLLSLGAASAIAQNDNSFGNLSLTNLGNANNAPVSQAQLNPTGNQQVSFKQVSLKNNNDSQAGNKLNDDNLQQQSFNENDNNENEPVQQQSINQSKSLGNEGLSFSLPKPSVSFGGGASRSSGKSHGMTFSKKMKKFNRRMSYVFAKKQKRSYSVDFCFAWSK